MKKFLFLTLILGAIVSTTSYAQPAGDPPSMLQQMKEKQKPELIAKVGLSEAQADKVIELNYETRMQAATELKDLAEADRSKKMAELMSAKEKKFAEFLTPEQITAMKSYYDEKRKNMQRKAVN